MRRKFYLDDFGLIRTDYEDGYLHHGLMLYRNNDEIDVTLSREDDKLAIRFNGEIDQHDEYSIIYNGLTYPVFMRFITHSPEFDEMFYPDLDKLGSFYRRNTCNFRVWAPLSKAAYVVVDNKRYQMNYTDKGVYELKLKGRYEGSIYHFEVLRNDRLVKFKDPFSYSCVKDREESYVVDTRKLNFKNIKVSITSDPIIYELSVRDFSSDENAPFKHKGKFLSFTEEGLKIDGYPVGIDYLRTLGVSHVQLMPVQTFDLDNGVYNWGYNPMEFNTFHYDYVVGRGPYAQINEFRAMVDSLHKNGLKVTLDVVYNHVYNKDRYALEKAVPYYFFRYRGEIMGNASWCGNELRSESPFFREYLKVINQRLVQIYDIDGLRFDLMGILDIDTINYLNDEMKSIKRDFLMYGEGWNMGDILPDDDKASMYNAYKMPEVFFFNPYYRDALRGNLNERYTKGYLCGNRYFEETIKNCLMGSYYYGLNMDQSLNYLDCHDNMTFYDKICGFDYDDYTKANIIKFALAMLIFAKGIPFIHAGFEFERSKKGVENSYNSDDSINKLDWCDMVKNIDIVNYLKKIIAVRKQKPVFRIDISAGIDYNYNLMIFSIGSFDIIINPTEYVNLLNNGITYKSILFPNGDFGYGLCNVEVDKYSLIVAEKYEN